MTDPSLTEVILKELSALPEARQADVLVFVRFLKIGLADVETTAQQFERALILQRNVGRKEWVTPKKQRDGIFLPLSPNRWRKNAMPE
jgi:hypothetical protein